MSRLTLCPFYGPQPSILQCLEDPVGRYPGILKNNKGIVEYWWPSCGIIACHVSEGFIPISENDGDFRGSFKGGRLNDEACTSSPHDSPEIHRATASGGNSRRSLESYKPSREFCVFLNGLRVIRDHSLQRTGIKEPSLSS